MTTTSAVSQPSTPDGQTAVHGPRLAGAWRGLGLAAWAAIFLTSLAAFFLAIYVWARWDSTPAADMMRLDPRTTAQDVQFYLAYQAGQRQLGLSLGAYAGLFAGLRLLSGIPYFVLSLLIARRRSDRLMALLFAMFLAVAGAAGRWISANWVVLPGWYPWTTVPVQLLAFILDCSVVLFYAFPDGRFVPRWTRWFALGAVITSLLRDFGGSSPLNPDNLPGVLGVLPVRIFLVAGVVVLVYRYRRDASPLQKQQIKWVVAGAALLSLIYFVHYFMFDFYYAVTGGGSLLKTPYQDLISELIQEPAWYVAQSLFAVCIGVSVFRYRLWDVDLVINRVLVYGSLTVLTMAVYLGAVTGLGSLFRGLSDPLVFFLATGIVAILFEPLRRRLQGLINRLMYGERDEPYAVLARLSNALETTPRPEDLLPALAATIGQALKIPYVALRLQRDGEEQQVAVSQRAEHRAVDADLVTFPLIYQGETVGSLRLARRAPGEEFSASDRRLLENIARQAGAAAQAVRLTGELVRSRAQIVAAREEERRRLRRDLHDGLGPILASQTLKMAAARELIRRSPDRAETLVDDVIQQNEATISEIRRLVYGLRPPALDELGLVEAVRDLVHQAGQVGGGALEIQVSGPPEGLPQLPAAVEANAYRIALEALTNAARHAHATCCTLEFECAAEDETPPALLIRIQDDGDGLPPAYRAGVGLRSMRERAEELGGRLIVKSVQPHGTRISAWLPLSV